MEIEEIRRLADKIEACADDGAAVDLLLECGDPDLISAVVLKSGQELKRDNKWTLKELFAGILRDMAVEPPDAPDAEHNRLKNVREWYAKKPSFSEWVREQGGIKF